MNNLLQSHLHLFIVGVFLLISIALIISVLLKIKGFTIQQRFIKLLISEQAKDMFKPTHKKYVLDYNKIPSIIAYYNNVDYYMDNVLHKIGSKKYVHLLIADNLYDLATRFEKLVDADCVEGIVCDEDETVEKFDINKFVLPYVSKYSLKETINDKIWNIKS